MNFARLNHILIPSTKDGRDRLFESRFARIFVRPLMRVGLSLTEAGRGLLGLSLIAGLMGLDVIHGQNYWLFALGFSLLVASIGARPLMRLRDVRIEVAGPGRVRVGADARFGVLVISEGRGRYSGLRVRLPFLPWDGTWVASNRSIAELAPGGRVLIEATARFVERGHHHIDSFGLGVLVPLGLAMGPILESRGTRFVVVPRITRVAQLDLPERARHQQGGIAWASHTGESSELLGLRAWRDGDRIRDLHARSWARLGEPVVREYQQEYFSRIAVVVDTDAAGLGEDCFEALISLTAGIVEYLMKSEAIIDLETTEGGAAPITVGRSLGGFDQALDRLAEVRSGSEFDPETAFAILRERLDRLSAVVFVTTKWDASRADFVDRLPRAGTGVRTILVGQPAPRGCADDRRVRVLPLDEIVSADRSRKGLLL